MSIIGVTENIPSPLFSQRVLGVVSLAIVRVRGGLSMKSESRESTQSLICELSFAEC